MQINVASELEQASKQHHKEQNVSIVEVLLLTKLWQKWGKAMASQQEMRETQVALDLDAKIIITMESLPMPAALDPDARK